MRALLFSLLILARTAVAEIPLEMGPVAQLEMKRLPNGAVDLTVAGTNPHFWTSVIPDTFDPEKHTVLTFDYFSPSGISAFSVRYRQNEDSMVLAASEPIPLAETWQPMSFDLSTAEPSGKRGRCGSDSELPSERLCGAD
mgnify:CR=1 FL=1